MEHTKKIPEPVTHGVAKTPVVMQMEALECGAASLAMVCAFFGKWIPLEQVRLDCGVSRDGSNAKNVLLAARSYGFEAKGFRYEPEYLKENGQFPCIIHWNFNHFVVLCGFKGDKVYLNDPARGGIVVTEKEFDESFTGICMEFTPTENFVPGGKPRGMLSYAAARLKGTGPAVAFVVITTVIGALFSVVYPGFTRVFMDQLLTGLNPSWFYPFIALLVLLLILQTTTAFFASIYSLKINGKLAVVGSTSYMWKVMKLPMEFFSQRMAGDILQRLQSNSSIATSLVGTIAPLVINAVMTVFYLVVMIRYSTFLAFIGLSSIVLNLFTARFISGKRINITRVMMRDAGKLEGTTVAGIEMIETIKASGAENGFFEKWAGYQASVNTQNVRYAKLNQYLGIIPSFISSLANAFVVFVAVYYAMTGSFTIGMIVAFQNYLMQFSAPAMSLISAGQTIQEMRTDMERLEDVMGYREQEYFEASAEGADTDFAKLSGSVEMKNVTFGYSRLAEPLIKDFNLSLKQGSRVAFVGASGCGKSTLSKLISGLYEPWGGEILFDGKPISQIDRAILPGLWRSLTRISFCLRIRSRIM